MLKNFTILFLLVGLLALDSFGQYRRAIKITRHYEFGLFRGYSTYYGDLANNGDYINMTDKGEAMGYFLRYNFDSHFALKFSYLNGTIYGSDDDATNNYERARGLNFTNTIGEYAITAEYNFLNFNMCRSDAVYSPYLFFGFALFKHNPLKYNMVGLDRIPDQENPLVFQRTEGQDTRPYWGAPVSWSDGDQGGYRTEYSLTQYSIPIGLGFKYRFYRNSTLAVELGYRQLFTDYIDDVSKSFVDNPLSRDKTSSKAYADPLGTHNEGDLRGTKRGNDYYLFFGLSLSFSTANCQKKNPVKCFSFGKWK